MPSRQIELQFPFKGINESSAFTRQSGGQNGTHTTASCLNVVGFDPGTGRNRGSARSGIRKYCPDRVNGANAGQCLVFVSGNIGDATRVTGPSSSPAGDTRVTTTGEVRGLGTSTVVVATATTKLIGVSGGTVGIITTAGVTPISSGTDALSATKPVIFAESFFQDIFFCDGANYKYYDTSANEMVTWTATAGTLPSQEVTKDVTGATNATPIVITCTSHGFADGDQVTIADVLGNTAANGTFTIANLTTDTFELVGSVGNGTYTSGGTAAQLTGSRCSLLAVWGGRIVLSGMISDPNNIFMSAVGDAFDWDYSPSTETVQQAVAGNVTNGYGKNSDVVTALIPFTDDILLIGGTHSIRKLLGNPAEGGLNVSITDITGIAPGKAWCQSPEGIIYFFGSHGGVYRLSPDGGVPNRLTSLTIDERLADIDLDGSAVTLEWDDRSVAVRVYVTPIDGSATTHYVWDVRNEAWWPFAYSNASHNPLAVRLMSGQTADDRWLLEYGQDGYVRMVDVDEESDDGESIDSYVFIGPFSNMLFTEISAILKDHSGNVTWSFCSASTMEKALTAKPRSSGRFRSGRNACQWPRTFVEQGYLKLAASGPWAMESLVAVVEEVTDTMRRTMRSI